MMTLNDLHDDTYLALLETFFDEVGSTEPKLREASKELARKEVLHEIRTMIRETRELNLEDFDYLGTALLEIEKMTDEEFENIREEFTSMDHSYTDEDLNEWLAKGSL